MDTFFEQIVAIRKTGKSLAAVLGIWVLAVILIVLVLFFGMAFMMIPIASILVIGIGYGALKLSAFFNLEYEYIITNGTMDVDKIIAKSSRKRMLSFELPTVSRIEKYNPAKISNISPKEIVIACNTDDPEAYLMVSATEGKGNRYLVFAPDERIRSAVVKFVPKFIANSAFK